MKIQVVKSRTTGKEYWVVKSLRGPYFVVQERGYSKKYTMLRSQFEPAGNVEVKI